MKNIDKEKFKQRLTKYNFRFVDFNNIISIKLDYALVVLVDFNLFDKILISDRLMGWNFLTGFFRMKLKWAILYNFFILLLAAILFMFEGSNINQYYLIVILLLGGFWIILWTIYYHTKSESLKKMLMIWLESDSYDGQE